MSSSRREADASPAILAAYGYARARVRSRQELLAYLRRRGYAAASVASAVAACANRGLIDDRACAVLWANAWARHGYAWAAIRLKLAAKGLGSQAVTEAERSIGSRPDDEARARALASSYLHRSVNASPPRSRHGQAARLSRVLTSRGFDQDLIERILEESVGALCD